MIALRNLVRGSVVFDPHDDPGHAARLRALNDPRAGRLSIEVRPGTRRIMWVARALAEALGKDIGVSGTPRNERVLWEQVKAWAIAEEITDAIVSRAHLLGSGLWRDLAEFAAETRVNLWLVVQQPTLRRTLNDARLDWGLERSDWTEFARLWQPLLHRDAVVGEHEEDAEAGILDAFPAVPSDDFTTFLDACQRLLRRSQYLRVERELDAAIEMVAGWSRSDSRKVPDEWSSFVRQLITQAGSWPQALTRLRGAQVALFLCGWWLRADLRRFRVAFDGPGAATLSEGLACALRRYVDPGWAAVAAARAATGLTPIELRAIENADVADDGSEVRTARGTFAIPENARAIMRANVALRAGDGADGGDPFFVARYHHGDTSLTERGIQRRLRVIGQEIGVELVSKKESWKGTDDAAWARRAGLSLVGIGEKHDG